MSAKVVLGLALQAFAIFLMWKTAKLGSQSPWSVTGFLFTLAICVYHGATEVAQAVLPGANLYRMIVAQALIDDWVLLVSAGVALLAVGYTIASRLVVRKGSQSGTKARRIQADWRVIVVPAMAALVTKVGVLPDSGGYWMDASGGYIFVPSMACLIAFVLQQVGPRLAVPALVAAVAILATVGSRTPVVLCLVGALVILERLGSDLKRRQLAIMVVCSVAAVFAISAARVTVGYGREALAGTLAMRVEALNQGGRTGLTDLGMRGDILEDLKYRFDGNAFYGGVARAFEAGVPGIGFETIGDAAAFAVPSLLLPSKLDWGLEERNEEANLTRTFYLSEQIDWTPTSFGNLYAYFEAEGLLLSALVLGGLLAVVDKAVSGVRSLHGIVFAGTLTLGIMNIEQGVLGIVLAFRTAVILAVAVWIAGAWIRATRVATGREDARLGLIRGGARRAGSAG